jgi:hypothetical protein
MQAPVNRIHDRVSCSLERDATEHLALNLCLMAQYVVEDVLFDLLVLLQVGELVREGDEVSSISPVAAKALRQQMTSSDSVPLTIYLDARIGPRPRSNHGSTDRAHDAFPAPLID